MRMSRLRSARLPVAVVLAAGAAPVWGPAPLSALQQEPAAGSGRISGVVTDRTTDGPVEGALMTLEGFGSEVTSAGGRFLFRDVPAGTHALEVRHLGFGARTISVEVSSALTTHLEIGLEPRAIAVEPIEVTVERRPLYLEDVGYYERLARGWGSFFDPTWVETRNVGFTRLRQFVDYLKGRVPQASCRETPVYLDGRRLLSETPRAGRVQIDLVAEMSSQDVGAVEVYATGHGIPIFALNDTTLVCGAVILWSKRWEDTAELPRITVELCEPDPTAPGRVLEGTVRDGATGVPLPGARVKAVAVAAGTEEVETIADHAGRYRFCGLPSAGPLLAWARYAREEGTPVSLAFPDTGTAVRDLEVAVSRPGELVGRVRALETGGPLRGADVVLEGTDRTARTNERGWFQIPDLPPGDYVVVVRAQGYADGRKTVTIRSGRTAEVRLALERG